MPVQLDTLTGTESIEVGGRCKKLKTWTFENSSFCVPGECDPDLILHFEDGDSKRASDLSQIENCE